MLDVLRSVWRTSKKFSELLTLMDRRSRHRIGKCKDAHRALFWKNAIE